LTVLGRLLGYYRIDQQLGTGGMGVVYRASDLKLGREVALKMLPEDCASDPEKLARLEREARVLASLNHTNIAAIHGVEHHEEVCFLVLELVPGETLEDRLRSGRMPVQEALDVCRQIAAGVEAAHEKGVIHRDLKPANVKITPGGTVKVLDFGLAKNTAAQAPAADLSQSPTLTADLTRAGTILGTAPYMSPEQVRGKPLDKRTDIWSFGCVLYEALTGRRAFRGETVSDYMAGILEREPDWSALPAATPPNVVRLMRRCLQKDARMRLRDIGDAHLELQAPEAIPTVAARPWWWAVAVAAVIGVLLGIGAMSLRHVSATVTRVVKFSLSFAANEFIPPSNAAWVAFSPDGSQVAYTTVSVENGVTTTHLYTRALQDPEPKAVEGGRGTVPFFSPDGKWLAFYHPPSQSLKKVALSGGAPIEICHLDTGMSGGVWGADGAIVFAYISLYRVPASGGVPVPLLEPDEKAGERFLRHPRFLPDGKTILYTASVADTESYDDARIFAYSLATKQKKLLIQGGTSPQYAPSGHLVYARNGKLLAVPFDARKLEVTGDPFPVMEGVFMSITTGMASYAISRDGDLMYSPGGIEGGQRTPLWVDRNGIAKALPVPPRSYLHPRLSPDERRLAIEIEGPSHDLYTYDLERGTLTKISFDGASHWPTWTPKGDRLTFRSWKTGKMTMWWMNADRSGTAELLANLAENVSPESWSPDGRWLAFTQMETPVKMDVYVMEVSDHKPRAVTSQNRFANGSPKFSPDGNWLAFCSNESGRPEVYVVAHPGPGPKIQISTDGGKDPVWRRKGGEIYYRNDDRMMAVSVAGGQRLTLSKPRQLWEGHYLAGLASSCGMPGVGSANYDVTADGERFLMIKDERQDVAGQRLHVVLNWSAELASARR
jgi:Tol biopolymer transport system component